MTNIFEDFLTNAGLYGPSIEITKENSTDFLSLLKGELKLNMYCNGCGDKRTFAMQGPLKMYQDNGNGEWTELVLAEVIERFMHSVELGGLPRPDGIVAHNVFEDDKRKGTFEWKGKQTDPYTHVMVLTYCCTYNPEHKIDFCLRTINNSLIKIGQYPSIADLEKPELKQYKHVFSDEDMAELRRAVGLNADGIGVGSYVYLRRIIERLVNEAKEAAIADGNNTPADFDHKTVQDSIIKLKGYLPDTLVESKEIYGIVSKGIHELSEDECNEYFPILYEEIMLILEEMEARRREELRKDNIKKSINKLNSKMGG